MNALPLVYFEGPAPPANRKAETGPEADSPVLMLDPRKADGFRRQSCAIGADGEQSEVRKINI